MELNGVKFDVFVAAPGIGKSYITDNYKNFVDLDEVRLKCKYFVPDDITRDELEQSKGSRTFEKRLNYKELFYSTLDMHMKSDKIILSAPHDEIINYFIQNNIRYCFVYPSLECKPKMVERWKIRGNSEKFIEDNSELFDTRYYQNIKDNRPAIHYIIQPNEYLSDIVKKAGVKFIAK